MSVNVFDASRRHDVSRRKQAEGEAVRSMVTGHNGWPILASRLDKRIAELRTAIEAGKLCHDDYRSYTGELQGLLFVGREVEKLIGQAAGGPEHGS